MARTRRDSPVYSMTGFGRASVAAPAGRVVAEVRGVNQRFLKVGIKLPPAFGHWEADIRAAVKDAVRRGVVDVYIGIEEEPPAARFEPDERLVRRYVARWRALQKKLGLHGEIGVAELAAMPQFFCASGSDRAAGGDRALDAAVQKALAAALAAFSAMRAREGTALVADVRLRVKAMNALLERMNRRAPEAVAAARERLRARLAEITAQTPSGVSDAVARALSILVERLDVSEELTRLAGHLKQIDSLLTRGGEIGKKLDFLTQELLREANTVGSKSCDETLTHQVVEAKVEIERIREQAQNIE